MRFMLLVIPKGYEIAADFARLQERTGTRRQSPVLRGFALESPADAELRRRERLGP